MSINFKITLLLCLPFSITFGVGSLQGSRVLDFSCQNLTELPTELSTQGSFLNLSCNDFTIIRANAFSSLTNLTIIRLDQNQISTIEPGAFNGRFPLQYLHLNVNILEVIRQNVFSSLTDLKELWLDHNKIKTLEKGAFNGLSNLLRLYLHYNALEVILPERFISLEQLTHLWLCVNKIEVIENGSFVGLLRLRYICLHNNKLVHVPNLSDLRNLVYIHLTGNIIQSLSAENIKQMKNVTSLHFGSPYMKSLPSLSTLWNLRYVTIYNMLLKRVPRHVLNGVDTLTTINLSRNKLTHIPELGGSVIILEVLYLHTNRIYYIPNLKPYMKLRHLDLRWNYITMLPEGYLSQMGSGHVSLDSNPIPCVRQLCWLVTSDLRVVLTCRDGTNWKKLDPSYICEGWLNYLRAFISHIEGCNFGWGMYIILIQYCESNQTTLNTIIWRLLERPYYPVYMCLTHVNFVSLVMWLSSEAKWIWDRSETGIFVENIK